MFFAEGFGSCVRAVGGAAAFKLRTQWEGCHRVRVQRSGTIRYPVCILHSWSQTVTRLRGPGCYFKSEHQVPRVNAVEELPPIRFGHRDTRRGKSRQPAAL